MAQIFFCFALSPYTYDDKRFLLLGSAFPKLGASWEGFALEQVVQAFGMAETECFYWGIHNQAELDLLIFQEGKRIGFEFKY